MRKCLFLSFMMILSSCSSIQFGGYNPPSINSILSNSSYKWEKDSTDHFTYYYESRYISKYFVDSAKVIFERMYPELLQFLDVENYENKLNLFMIESRDKMKDIVGIETNGIALTEDNTVLSVFNDKVKTFAKHEFCHVICCNEWGMYKEQWLNEGLAVGSDKKWWGYELHSLAHYLKSKRKLIPIKEIIREFHNHSSLISYPECGSFVLFVKEKYGISIVKELWEEGINIFEKRFNKTITSVEQEWLAEIEKYDDANIDYEEKIFKAINTKL
jgi:hypothetical protein